MQTFVLDYLKNRAEMIQCWRDLRKVRGVRDVSTLVGFAFNHCICPVQVYSELIEFMQTVASIKPSAALEIGTHRGGTLFLLCRLADPRAKIISTDLPHGRFGGGYKRVRIGLYRKFADEGQSLHLLRQDSHKQETVGCIKDILCGASLDYLFIDGDHSYEGVRHDFEVYSPLVRRGGLVAFHDIAGNGTQWGCGVPRFWSEVKSRYLYREIIANPKQEGNGVGLLRL
ncbi:MAG TPA: class I SAM-dependent methyltransferase [Terriglobia bacterium]|nr:class I SAM-dependent methyltransferase [Terriglobia bacterium]